MNAKTVRYAMLSASLIAVFGLLAAPTANAGLASDAQTFHGVTAYHDLTYATTSSCGGYTGYKVQADEYRFYRSTNDRGARVTEHFATEYFAQKCDNSGPISSTLNSGSHDACFGCNGNTNHWSRDYIFNYSYPYVRPAGSAIIGSKLKFRVYLPYSGGRTYYDGTVCSLISLRSLAC